VLGLGTRTRLHILKPLVVRADSAIHVSYRNLSDIPRYAFISVRRRHNTSAVLLSDKKEEKDVRTGIDVTRTRVVCLSVFRRRRTRLRRGGRSLRAGRPVRVRAATSRPQDDGGVRSRPLRDGADRERPRRKFADGLREGLRLATRFGVRSG